MTKHSAHSGFTLVEIAIVLTIIGILLGSGIVALNGIMDDVRYRTTQDRLRGVSQALAVYAQNYMYMPCPANPAVSPVTGRAIAACGTYTPGGNGAIGIVPYATIGLTQEQARDGYGNFITYAVNANYATEATVHTGIINVHNSCRLADIWVSGSGNKNRRKAHFCCNARGLYADTMVRLTSGGTVLHPTRNLVPLLTLTGDQDVGFTGMLAGADNQTPAFVLISHGKNGYGAFRADGSVNRFVGPTTGRADEMANENNDSEFIQVPRSGQAANYFDDVLYWQTPDQLISAFGRDSCARP